MNSVVIEAGARAPGRRGLRSGPFVALPGSTLAEGRSPYSAAGVHQ